MELCRRRQGAFSQTLKEARGRESLADDPVAYIENMAESGILLNNKNWVKQHLLLLAENRPTSLLNVSKAWYVKTVDAQGNEEWIPASPGITAGMNGMQIEAALKAFEQKMEKMKQAGDATQKREHLEISYPQTNSEEREHEVRVMRGGEEYVIYVNGDPQLAHDEQHEGATRERGLGEQPFAEGNSKDRKVYGGCIHIVVAVVYPVKLFPRPHHDARFDGNPRRLGIQCAAAEKSAHALEYLPVGTQLPERGA